MFPPPIAQTRDDDRSDTFGELCVLRLRSAHLADVYKLNGVLF
eukprot:gene10075-2243_t